MDLKDEQTSRTASNTLRLRRLGIDTSQETVIYMMRDCHVCRSEGFTAHARVLVNHDGQSIIATVNVVTRDLLAPGEASLSEAAWKRLGAAEGSTVNVHHAAPLRSLSHVRSKVYGNRLDPAAVTAIIQDVTEGRYSDIHLSSFITACAGDNMDRGEMVALTRAMIAAGQQLDWGKKPVVDKHCVGGLPGNRTTPIVVAIVAANGFSIPKTSSRAITSPAGTADTMETLAPVDLDLNAMRRVVDQEGGCIVWGGAVSLSPADDVLIRVERALDLDSEGQLVASVLSKKIAAGATHVVLDLPTGPTAKVRSFETAQILRDHLVAVAREFGLTTSVLVTDGTQPVGRGIGPALEARDVLSVLQNEVGAPMDLRERALELAGAVLDLVAEGEQGTGRRVAQETLDDGRAWEKFQAICEAQGGMRVPPRSGYTFELTSQTPARIVSIDNRLLARAAKLAGAPSAKAAGVDLHVRIGTSVAEEEPLFTLHAESPGELSYAREFIAATPEIIRTEDVG